MTRSRVGSERRGIVRIRRAADHAEDVHQVVDDAVDAAVDRRAAQQRSQRTALAERDARPGVAARGHDRGQAAHALRMLRRQHLRDHAAHRCADDVSLVDTGRVEYRDGITGHVRQVVRRAHLHPHQHASHRRADIGHRQVHEARGATGFAIIEQHHPVTVSDQRIDELLGPHGGRHAEAHDQQEWTTRRVACDAVLQTDSIPLCNRHGRSSSYLPSVTSAGNGASAAGTALSNSTSNSSTWLAMGPCAP